ncbi:MAG TPA: citrate/2-methylcitrate synthase [Anaerolineales bacterium]|nr:citrate/2-methylcitrate synthase [Anaerolineales bacterium]
MTSAPSDALEATRTRLSRVDGQAGELIIGGFRLEDLAPRATFEEVIFLLWNDRLPTATELADLRDRLAQERVLAPAARDSLRAAVGRGVRSMDALRLAVESQAIEAPTASDDSPAAWLAQAERLVARMPMLAAAYARLRAGLEPIAPPREIGHAAAYLYALRGELADSHAVRALETYFNTVIDHGLNASTFTARVVASTHSDMVAAVAAALAALKGPLHGGAPGPALAMMEEIERRQKESGRSLEGETEAYVRETVAGGGRLMGFGHRVYKVRDPRADVLGRAADGLASDPERAAFLDRAKVIEQVTLRVLEEVKPGRQLRTNVEFYTAMLLQCIGLPPDLFTPTFAVARVAGWTAHILEQRFDGRLIRPLEVYIGAERRAWVPLESRQHAEG